MVRDKERQWDNHRGSVKEIKIKSDRDRQRERETDRDRQTERQIDGQTDR